MDASLSSKLEPYLLMAKSAKGAAAAKLIQDATSAAGVYVFGELLEMPSIAELRQSETHSQSYALLELFAYQTYSDYKAKRDSLPALSTTQIAKLKHLSLVSFAMQSRVLPYAPLLEALDLPTVHALESLIIDALYSDLLHGKLDQNEQQFEVEYTVGRDVPNDALGLLLGSLEDWSAATSSLLSTLDAKLSSLSSVAAASAREAEDHERTLAANLKEISERREKSKRSTDSRREGGSLRETSNTSNWARKEREDDMDVDDPVGSSSGAKGKNRKASQEISGKTRSKRNRM